VIDEVLINIVISVIVGVIGISSIIGIVIGVIVCSVVAGYHVGVEEIHNELGEPFILKFNLMVNRSKISRFAMAMVDSQ